MGIILGQVYKSEARVDCGGGEGRAEKEGKGNVAILANLRNDHSSVTALTSKSK